MLKGYLLSKVRTPEKKTILNQLWKDRIRELHEWTSLEDLDFFKAWLRAKYAETIRPGRKGSTNEDFEKIGTSFHTWVKNRLGLIGLHGDKEFGYFVEDSFRFYVDLYLKIRLAHYQKTRDLENLYFIDWFGVAGSLSYPLLIAPINEDDSETIQNQKLQMVAHFLDCFTVFRSVNQRTLGQSSIRYTLYSLVKEIRNKDLFELGSILKAKLTEQEEKLEGIRNFTLNQQNKRFVRYFLSRLTHFIEAECGVNSDIETYLSDDVKKPAQIEHIWSDIYESHKDEFDQRYDFEYYRNSLGGLILLPKGTNQSFNKDEYHKKLPHYLKQNLLAQSLHLDCYQKNPNFLNWRQASGLSFKAHTDFKKLDIEERTTLYEEIAKQIWSVNNF